ncbi:MAG: transposase [Firmicutes bacterium]|nr:transposase [Bacillota bacterium]
MPILPTRRPIYATTNRDGYREYKSDPKICTNCPSRERCPHSKDCVKTVQRHIWKHYEELADDARYTPKYQDLYKQRKWQPGSGRSVLSIRFFEPFSSFLNEIRL